ncbi:diguanylate cyclase [bacterium]|nr:diguanylate cyclase [bacterium]
MLTREKERILIVDDEKMNLKVLADLLQDSYTLILATSGEQALKRIAEGNTPDLILLDVVMPVVSGYEVLKRLKENESSSQIPVIFVTALDSPEEEERGLKLGAVDYITKPFSPPIVRMRVQNHLRFLHQFRLLEQLALLDGLTEIPNRRQFDELFKKEYARALRNGTALSVAMIDVDFFKQYNDHYGHAMGDTVLQKIANTLELSLMRPADSVARYGGEEFVMILPETDAVSAAAVAERARKAVAKLSICHQNSDVTNVVTVSIGITTSFANRNTSKEKILQQADRNLYRAKFNGRDQVVG